MNFEWVGLESVDEEVINEFDSGNYAFNIFLQENAKKWQNNGETVTYLCVDSEEFSCGNISRVYGFASINTMGLLYSDTDGKNSYLQCAEIRLFAIARALQRNGDPERKYSEIILKSFLQELYYMSMSVIGFKAVFLNSNDKGYNLYKRCGFQTIEKYVAPDEDAKIDTAGCIPLILIMNDDAVYGLYE